MQKWVRRSLHATLAVGAIGLCTANLANADDTKIHVDSQSTSVAGQNGVASGNALSVPVVAGVLNNQVAHSHFLLVGLGDALNLGPGSDCSVVVDTSASSLVGDNQAAGGNAISAPVVAVVAGNEVASSIVGDSFNSGEACDSGATNGGSNSSSLAAQPELTGDPQLSSEPEFNEELLPIGGLGNLAGGGGPLGAVTGLVGGLPLGAVTGILGGLPIADVAGNLPIGGLGGMLGNPSALIGTVSSLAGLGGLGGLPLAGLTDTLPLDSLTGSLPLGGLPVVSDLAPAAAPEAAGEFSTSEQTEGMTLQNETTELQSNTPVATELANGGSGSSISVTSSAVSVTGNNSILSGNSLSIPVVAGVLDNQVAAAVIGDAINQGAGGGDLLGLLD